MPIGYSPQKTIGTFFLYPGKVSSDGSFESVIVPPTFISLMLLIDADLFLDLKWILSWINCGVYRNTSSYLNSVLSGVFSF